MLIGIACAIVVLLIIIIIFKVSTNKFRFVDAKIDESLKNIEMYLDKKYDLLCKIEALLTKKKVKCSFFENFDRNVKKANYFELKEDLDSVYDKLLLDVEEKEDVFAKKDISKVLKDLKQNQIELSASIKYYNSSVTNYDHLVKSFPSNFVAFFKRYKVRDLFGSDVKESFNILNEE